MDTEQLIWTPEAGWSPAPKLGSKAALVLVFGNKAALADRARMLELRKAYPAAHFVGGSTAGEIAGAHVLDGSVVATAVRFKAARTEAVHFDVPEGSDSRAAGVELAKRLDQKGLVHVFVVSDGHNVNGSELVRGMTSVLPPRVAITGGLAGDGSEFRSTLTVSDEGTNERRIAALGLYGDKLKVGYGSLGGWDPFGPQRVVTRAKGNVLFELDGQPALALYKKYLGEHASGLPATGLLFPLEVRAGNGTPLTRTILDVSEADQSLTFAGDIPQGATARLMKANFDRLVEGAHGAAEHSLRDAKPELAILISCVGRKLVLKQRVEDELEAVQQVLGAKTPLAGFYSYGEICPAAPNANCELHNQTMTITTLREA